MAADPYAALEARAAGAASAPAVDPYAALEARAAGQSFAAPVAAPTPTTARPGVPAPLGTSSPLDAVTGFVGENLGSFAGQVAGGLRSLWDLAKGEGGDQALADLQSTERTLAYQPKGAYDAAGAAAAASSWDPLNWPGVVLGEAGKGYGDIAQALGAPPAVVGVAQAAPSALGILAAGRGAFRGAAEPYTVEAESGATAKPAAAAAPASAGAPGPAAAAPAAPSVPGSAPGAAPPEAAPDGAPVPGGLPKDAQAERSAILERVGIPKADQRVSAVAGNAKDAATDYQSSKVDEPAGRLMGAQLESERNALAGFTQQLIQKVGGTVGIDEDSLMHRGSIIARPFDSLRQWFDNRMHELYGQADEQSQALAANGNPTAYTQLQGVEQLMADPTFRNTLLAKDQGGLLNAAKAQLEQFRKGNPTGFTPQAAEQVRQWFNQVWTPDNSYAIGRLKGALDDDVLATSPDLYGQARAVNVLKHQILEDPKGIAQLFDADPKTPINRITPLEKIPDRIMALPADQFANLVSTLKDKMPGELRGEADAALGQIKGQLLNRLLKAGTQTRSGRAAQVWHGQDVSTTIGQLSRKLQIAFVDDPAVQGQLKDLNAAGQILSINESYPGAYAQAANLSKRGLGARLLPWATKAAGAAAGGVLGPVGEVAGALAGGALGEEGASTLAERAALKRARSRIGVR